VVRYFKNYNATMIPLKSKKKQNDRSGILERFRADNLSNYIKICVGVFVSDGMRIKVIKV
jgi:hypothetical protein